MTTKLAFQQAFQTTAALSLVSVIACAVAGDVTKDLVSVERTFDGKDLPARVSAIAEHIRSLDPVLADAGPAVQLAQWRNY
ncbi:hypothetical protein [Microvirga sp. BSC39]|uniref:hypothetical protein n=1 Tax=Microvirga sp. BSC39 TaxID=1549810 RepID=UPI0004E91985|nr:hypothetical protein [Microvirga sp. BSC39]KFG69665.1 hypothetical protein JH26_08890 [Microvirga sp. BSC39]